MTTAVEENEVQGIEVSSLNRNSKFWLVLFYWGGQTGWGEYESKKYLLYCFLLLPAIVSAPHSAVTIKAATNFSGSE